MMKIKITGEDKDEEDNDEDHDNHDEDKNVVKLITIEVMTMKISR